MKDINKRALKCYVETLEKENTLLHDFVAEVHNIYLLTILMKTGSTSARRVYIFSLTNRKLLIIKEFRRYFI